VLAEDDERVESDEDGRDVLDHERDPDRQASDRDEVRPLNECDAADPERHQERQLAPFDLQVVTLR
jgi:hypothetical protein